MGTNWKDKAQEQNETPAAWRCLWRCLKSSQRLFQKHINRKQGTKANFGPLLYHKGKLQWKPKTVNVLLTSIFTKLQLKKVFAIGQFSQLMVFKKKKKKSQKTIILQGFTIKT